MARELAAGIAEEDERELLLSDLATVERQEPPPSSDANWIGPAPVDAAATSA